MIKKYKKVIILIILILLLIGSIFTYYFIFKKNDSSSKNTTTSINYKEDVEDDFSDCEVISVDLNNVKSKYKITKRGVYKFTGKLKGYIEINTKENVKIILDDATITNSSGPAIYVINAKKTYIELSKESSLEDGSVYKNFDKANGVIYSKDDLVLSGDGILNIKANYQDGIVSTDNLVIKSGTYNIESNDDAIRGSDSVVIIDGDFTINASGDGIKSTNTKDSSLGYVLIKNGKFNITSELDAIQAETNLELDDGCFTIKTGGGSSNSSKSNTNWGRWGSKNTNSSSDKKSSKGIKAGKSILIKKTDLNADTSDDTIHSNSVVEINNGTLKISSGDDGIHADKTLTINNGSINIEKSYEGLEANNITINDGEINVVASDDGINVNGGVDDSAMNGRPGQNNTEISDEDKVYLTINGGKVTIDASGDGLDSNGYIVINGGAIYVDGPTDNGNAAIDYSREFKITGGELIAIGSSGMAQNVTTSENGSSVLINLTSNQKANTKIELGDISYTSKKSFSSIVIYSSKLETSKSYDLKLNGEVNQNVTITNSVTNIGNSMMGGMQGGPRGGAPSDDNQGQQSEGANNYRQRQNQRGGRR